MERKKIKLKKLFLGLDVQIYGDKEVEISGLSSHSKTVSLGHLFVAKSGLTSNGAEYIDEALLGGAKAILCDLYNPFLKSVTQVVCKDPASIEGELAKRYFDQYDKPLKVIGLTGTNGKTTTSYLIRNLLGEEKTGLIGTIEYLIGAKSYPATLTTPDVITNHKMLAQMKEAGQSFAVMEVTSHGLVQKRVEKIDFDMAIFTNLSRDHLDYHQTMHEYAKAKSLLFAHLAEGKVALINRDDPWYMEMIQNCKATVKTYGIHPSATYRARHISFNRMGTRFDFVYEGKTTAIQTPLVGKFNVYNTLAALGCALEQGVDLSSLIKKLKRIKAPKGRLQPIANTRGYEVFVDFAHTPDALKNTLETLKEIPHNRLITVFGCGGDRDQEKRAQMGQVVSSKSDLVFITSDNPRTEDPQKICEEVYKGCLSAKSVEILVDRKKAIEKALYEGKEGDLILIAGRGHEPYQIIGRNRIPFSDALVVEDLLECLANQVKI